MYIERAVVWKKIFNARRELLPARSQGKCSLATMPPPSFVLSPFFFLPSCNLIGLPNGLNRIFRCLYFWTLRGKKRLRSSKFVFNYHCTYTYVAGDGSVRDVHSWGAGTHVILWVLMGVWKLVDLATQPKCLFWHLFQINFAGNLVNLIHFNHGYFTLKCSHLYTKCTVTARLNCSCCIFEMHSHLTIESEYLAVRAFFKTCFLFYVFLQLLSIKFVSFLFWMVWLFFVFLLCFLNKLSTILIWALNIQVFKLAVCYCSNWQQLLWSNLLRSTWWLMF